VIAIDPRASSRLTVTRVAPRTLVHLECLPPDDMEHADAHRSRYIWGVRKLRPPAAPPQPLPPKLLPSWHPLQLGAEREAALGLGRRSRVRSVLLLWGLRAGAPLVSRASPAWARSILAEIYLRRACSCQAILSRRRRRGRRGCVPPLGEPNGCLS
jgi:hypothetical protein